MSVREKSERKFRYVYFISDLFNLDFD